MNSVLLHVDPCENGRESWCRVHIFRDGRSTMNDLSWPLALRILPRLLARHGVEMPDGFWWGRIVRL